MGAFLKKYMNDFDLEWKFDVVICNFIQTYRHMDWTVSLTLANLVMSMTCLCSGGSIGVEEGGAPFD